MTDRELLELAAKATGYEVWPGRGHQDEMLFMRLEKPDLTGKCSGREWNPLTDDGDAMRLAVKLGLRVYAPADGDDIAVVRDYSGLHVQEIGGDHNKITRRAITRAAAEIGKQK